MANVKSDVPADVDIRLLEQLCRIEAILRLLASDKIEEIKQSKWTDLQEKIYEACAEPRTVAEIARAIEKKRGNINKSVYAMADRGQLVCLRVEGEKRYAQGL